LSQGLVGAAAPRTDFVGLGDHLVILFWGGSRRSSILIFEPGLAPWEFLRFSFSGSSLVGVLPYTLPSFLREHSVAR